MDTTEQLPFHFSLSCIGEGNGNPLQYSCLENPKVGGAWWTTVYGVAQSRTWLKQLSSNHFILLHFHYSLPDLCADLCYTFFTCCKILTMLLLNSRLSFKYIQIRKDVISSPSLFLFPMCFTTFYRPTFPSGIMFLVPDRLSHCEDISAKPLCHLCY